MSVQFGKWNFDGRPVDQQDLHQVRPLLTPYGSDAEGAFCKDNFLVLHRAFHTTKESRNELQPHVSRSGCVITWDGRLDNRKELILELKGDLSARSTDLSIVASAYEQWGTMSFGRLIGDWALSVWEPTNGPLILAKDLVGTHHLYYTVDRDQVRWSTVIEPLVLLAGRTFTLNEEYIAGWLSFFPAPQLTPYAGIHSVPPSCFVRLESGKRTVCNYWNFDPAKTIRCRTDVAYEDQFRAVFAESVRRRLRSDTPVLAELSGGMDSSSIVCMADEIIARGEADVPRLDTLSYYDDSEPNWNERPYFSKVEEKRGRTGCHISVDQERSLKFEFGDAHFAAVPGLGEHFGNDAKHLRDWMTSHGSRVVLSGIGGDETMGGVPTPVPELADLLAKGRTIHLARRLGVWALRKKRPWFQLLKETAGRFLPPSIALVPKSRRPPFWLNADFVQRNKATLQGYEGRLKLFGPRPSFQENLNTLGMLQRQFACFSLPSELPYEKRYPYLDRDLLEFVYAVPREQLVRPGQRRSLMRRALIGIVPDELLNRKTKASVARGPLVAVAAESVELVERSGQMATVSLGIVNNKAFCEAVQGARAGRPIPIVALVRTLGLECWLSHLKQTGIVDL
jgi:asparagine synthase (glutamine-hydrolysing)